MPASLQSFTTAANGRARVARHSGALYVAPMRLPTPLRDNARIALVAPAGPLRNAADLDIARANVAALGWTAVVGPHALDSTGYLAGCDADRVADLNAALRDPDIDAVWCLRGGYGAMRLLDALDTSGMRTRPKTLIGYSDITALHAALSRAADVITFHGPTARSPLTEYSRASLVKAVVDHTNSCGHAPDATTLRGGKAMGRLVGGNLSLLAALAGTPYAPDYTHGILVVEDVGEPLYRIDRLLRQLMLSGALSSLAGIAFGHFTDTGDDSASALEALLLEAADAARVPAIAGIPMGHIDDQWTIPLGARAELDADACTLTVDFSELGSTRSLPH